MLSLNRYLLRTLTVTTMIYLITEIEIATDEDGVWVVTHTGSQIALPTESRIRSSSIHLAETFRCGTTRSNQLQLSLASMLAPSPLWSASVLYTQH